MEITSRAIKQGHFEDKYGKRTKIMIDEVPSLSIPFEIQNAPQGTVAYALILDDKDAVPVCGYTWIHWLAANITTQEVEEDASRKAHDFIQGKNSWGFSYYGGMMPPNAPHKYDLRVFALNKKLDLKNGFTQEELEKAMEGHVLDMAILSGMYAN